MDQRPVAFGQIYLSCAVLAFAASFVPLYTPRQPGDVYETLTIWSSITDYDSVIGVLAVLLVLILVGLAVTAGFGRHRSLAVPAVLLLVSLVGAVMLLDKVGEGSYPPAFGAGAGLLFGTTVVLAVAAVSEIVSALRGVDVRSAHLDA